VVTVAAPLAAWPLDFVPTDGDAVTRPHLPP